MFEGTREMPQLGHATFAHTLVINMKKTALESVESWNHLAHGPCIHEYF